MGSTYNGCLITSDRENDIVTFKNLPIKIPLTKICCGTKHCIGFPKIPINTIYLWGEHVTPESKEKEEIIFSPIEISL